MTAARTLPHRFRVLLVEDDDEMRRLVAKALAADGAEIVEARDGVEAGEILHDDGPFQLVVTDIRMPRRTGIDLLRTLREGGSKIPAIIMTGFGDGLWAAYGLSLDKTLVFSKPFDIDDLRTAVRNLDVSEAPSRRKRSVLVAEDDDELRRLIVMLLEDVGYEVHSAADGRAAVALLSAASRGEAPVPDVVVMDVRMPKVGGIEVLRAMRLADWEIPVILMTAFPDENVLRWASELRASCTLAKPFDGGELERMVDLLCSLASRRKRATIRPMH